MINIFPHRWDRQKQKQKKLLTVETPNSSWWRHPTPSWWSHPHTTTSDEKPPPPPGLLLQVDLDKTPASLPPRLPGAGVSTLVSILTSGTRKAVAPQTVPLSAIQDDCVSSQPPLQSLPGTQRGGEVEDSAGQRPEPAPDRVVPLVLGLQNSVRQTVEGAQVVTGEIALASAGDENSWRARLDSHHLPGPPPPATLPAAASLPGQAVEPGVPQQGQGQHHRQDCGDGLLAGTGGLRCLLRCSLKEKFRTRTDKTRDPTISLRCCWLVVTPPPPAPLPPWLRSSSAVTRLHTNAMVLS